MNTGNEGNGTKICPYCAEQIKQEAIKCKHCGEFLVEENNPSIIETTVSETTVQGKSNLILIVLFLGAAFLHVISCAQSPLVFISASNPISSLVNSLAYSIPGMVMSVIFLVPVVNYLTKKSGKGFFKGFTLKSVTISLYIGAAIRLALFINKFMV
jgi:hypothetical protein